MGRLHDEPAHDAARLRHQARRHGSRQRPAHRGARTRGRPPPEGDLQDQPQGGVVRRRADHVHRLQVHLGSDRPRQGHLRQDGLRADRERRRLRQDHRGRHLQAGLRRLEGLVRRVLRRLSQPPAPGQGPRRGDEGRVRVVGWSLVRQVDEGRQRRAHPQPQVLGPQAQPRQGRLQVHHRHVRRAGGLQDGAGGRALPAGSTGDGPAEERTQHLLRGEGGLLLRGHLAERGEAAARQQGRAAGPRLRDRPRRHREAAVRGGEARHQGHPEPHHADQRHLVHGGFREVHRVAGEGRPAHAGRRLGEAGRGLDQERPEGDAHHQVHDRQQAP